MAKGGSRFGAGRPSWKSKAERALSIDIRELARKGYLRHHYSFSWNWVNNHGEPAGSVSLQTTNESLKINYTWTTPAGESRAIENVLYFAKTDCHFGGSRTWLVCPKCNEKCAKIFLNKRNGHYACRKCVGITYYSQCEDAMDRAWRKQNKLESKLGKHFVKPKGMHQSTHTRIFNKILECEDQREEYLYSYAKRLGMLSEMNW